MGKFGIMPNFCKSRSIHFPLFVPNNYVDLECFYENLPHYIYVVWRWATRYMMWIYFSHLEFKGIEFILCFYYFLIFLHLMIFKTHDEQNHNKDFKNWFFIIFGKNLVSASCIININLENIFFNVSEMIWEYYPYINFTWQL
jgi:hypothetical protein